MSDIIRYFEKNKGYGRTKDLINSGIHPREIYKALEAREIERIKPGLFKLVDFRWDETSNFVDICLAYKYAVICLTSALSYYDLSTFNPSGISVAVPHNVVNFKKIKYPPHDVYYFRDRFYKPGIETVTSKSGKFRIYSREKTICDMFRYRKKLGEDLALEGLKNYLKRKGANIPRLMHYAEICRVKSIFTPYLKGILG